MSILSYSEEDSNDLSDLGLSSNKEKPGGGDFSNNQVTNNKRFNEFNEFNSNLTTHVFFIYLKIRTVRTVFTKKGKNPL